MELRGFEKEDRRREDREAVLERQVQAMPVAQVLAVLGDCRAGHKKGQWG